MFSVLIFFSCNYNNAYFLRETSDHIVMERKQNKNKIFFSLLRRGTLPKKKKAIFNLMDPDFFVKWKDSILI